MNTLRTIPAKKWLWLPGLFVFLLLIVSAYVLNPRSSLAQVETVPATSESFVWVSSGRVDGHLALYFSPAAAFSPDSSSLAIVDESKLALMNLATGGFDKVLHPQIPNLRDLDIESANYVSPKSLFLFAVGVVHEKGKPARPTPLLGFQWEIDTDAMTGKLEAIGASGGFGRPRYFPSIGYLGMYKDSTFTVWNPFVHRGGQIKVAELTREPHLYTFSPDRHWLVVAQVGGGGSPDPIVVRLSDQKLVTTLPGHQGTVMSIAFSRDDTKVATACEDGKVRIFSVEGWKLLETLTGHHGPVRWAEFSPDGRWVASGGEDHTVKIWSVADGKLVQTLSESEAPIATLSFSPNGSYLAASTEHSVLVWKKTPTGQ